MKSAKNLMGFAFVVLVLGPLSGQVNAQKRMVPHLTSAAGDFLSEVVLSNLTEEPKSYRLLGYSLAGGQETVAEGDLGPFQTLTANADDLFGANLSHFEIDQGDAVAVSVIYRRSGEDAGPAHVHERSVQSRHWRVYPGNAAVTWDGLAAVNTGTAATDIAVTHLDAEGQTLQGPLTVHAGVSPNAKVLYLFGTDFPSLANTSFEITATEPLALLALRGNLASDFLWENRAVPLEAPEFGPNRSIPHVTSSSGGFRSQVIVANPFEAEETFELIAYDLAGNPVATAEGSVAAGQTLFQDIDQLFGTEVSHFDIAPETELLVSIGYQRNAEDSGPAQVHNASGQGTHWRIYPGNQEVTWDGLAAVNRGDVAANLVVWQIDANGNVLRGPITVVDQLAPRAKGLYVFATDFPSEAGAMFEVTASQPLAVVALRGNQASDFLWENSAVPLPQPVPGPVPPSRIDYAFTFDPNRGATVMVGGYDENFDLLDDTWFWSGRRWRQAETQGSPLPRSHHGSAFDGNSGTMVIFGGVETQFQRRNDFRSFDGTNWQDFSGDPAVPAEDGELAYDSTRNVLVLTVSNGNALQTWEHQGSQWQRKLTATDPGKRIDQGFVYDSNRQRIVMFGGLGPGNQPVAQTWEYDGNDWAQMKPTASPPALAGMAMYFDSVRNRVVLFGGMNAQRDVTDETWEYDGATWTKIATPNAPEPRWVAFAAFNPKRGVATLFGGEGEDENGLIMFGDTWELDATGWHKR